MLAGILHEAGYFMGEKFHQPRDSNPKGFFEWSRINRINEDILAAAIRPRRMGRLAAAVSPAPTVARPGPNQRWLLALPPRAEVGAPSERTAAKIRDVLARTPFAYKDPRFSYTLPAWAPFLDPDALFLCVFRDPAVTVASILNECRSQAYLASLRITRRGAYRVWTAMYARILDRLDPAFGRFVYLHYDQVADGSALASLSERLQAALTADFVDPRLRRTKAIDRPPRKARAIYDRLCRLAGCVGARARE
jgi:hypothetical protein